jgi:hypothetical protein
MLDAKLDGPSACGRARDGRERRETGSIMGSEWGRIDKHSRGGAALLQRCLGLGCLDAWNRALPVQLQQSSVLQVPRPSGASDAVTRCEPSFHGLYNIRHSINGDG